MCRICKEAFKVSSSKFLKDVGDAIKDGMNPEHFKDVLDAVLDTEMPEVDEDKDDAFERSYRDR
jgi:hypothetical protein